MEPEVDLVLKALSLGNQELVSFIRCIDFFDYSPNYNNSSQTLACIRISWRACADSRFLDLTSEKVGLC